MGLVGWQSFHSLTRLQVTALCGMFFISLALAPPPCALFAFVPHDMRHSLTACFDFDLCTAICLVLTQLVASSKHTYHAKTR